MSGLDPDIDNDLDVVAERRDIPQDAVLSNSFDFGGQNVYLIVTSARHHTSRTTSTTP